jgi:hypothetical protein
MQDPLFIRLALDIQVGTKIQKLTHDSGKIRSPIKVFRLIDQPVMAHHLVLQHDIISVEDDQINPTESRARQIGQNIEARQLARTRSRHYRQIEVALCVKPAGDR